SFRPIPLFLTGDCATTISILFRFLAIRGPLTVTLRRSLCQRAVGHAADAEIERQRAPFRSRAPSAGRARARSSASSGARGGCRAGDDRPRLPRSGDPEPAPAMVGGHVEADAATTGAVDHELADLHRRVHTVIRPEHEHLATVDR